MDNKHYIDHSHRDILKNQEKLCKALSNIEPYDEIENEQANPMTIRLLEVKESLKEIRDFVSNIENIIEKVEYDIESAVEHNINGAEFKKCFVNDGSASGSFVNKIIIKQVNKNKNSKTNPFKSSHLNYRYIEKTKKNETIYIPKNEEIHFYQIHRAVYRYFSNFYSCLERIAFEIKIIYEVNDLKHWSYLTKVDEDVCRQLISGGNNGIVSKTTSELSLEITDSLKYRHRLIHDGIIKLNFNYENGKLYLPDDPNSYDTNYNIELINYSEKKFNKLLQLLDEIYGQMYIYLH